MLLGKFPLATVAIATSILVTSPPPTPAFTGGGDDYYHYQPSRRETARELREFDERVKIARENEEIEAIINVILQCL